MPPRCSAQLPKRMDEVTMLMTVLSAEDTLIYNYRLDLNE